MPVGAEAVPQGVEPGDERGRVEVVAEDDDLRLSRAREIADAESPDPEFVGILASLPFHGLAGFDLPELGVVAVEDVQHLAELLVSLPQRKRGDDLVLPVPVDRSIFM
jgi:hypothetical protein